MDKKNIEAIYPLTSMQQTLLLHAIQNPKQDLGFLHIQFDIKGTLDVNVLSQAWQALLNRHQVLRTAIYWENLEQPLQVVQKQVLPIWEYIDYRQLNPVQQKQKLTTLKSKSKQQGLALNQAPLAHVSLIQQANDHYHFICHCHHILLDGWSGNLMVTELFQLYEIQLLGTDQRLPLAFPFQSYVTWAQQQDTELAKTFWKQQLKSLPTKTTWPVKIAKVKSNDSHHYTSQTQTASRALTTEIQQLCSQGKITLSSFLQGMWSLLLAAYTGEDDVTFGMTLSGRTAHLEDIESAIGMFSNVLPLHSKIDQQEPLISWLQSIAAQQAEINNFDYVTLAQIQTWQPINIPSLLVLENHAQEVIFTNKDLKVINFKSGLTTNYPITLAIQPGEHLTFTLVYDGQFLQKKQAQQLLENWQDLITSCVAQPHQKLASVLHKIKPALSNYHEDITSMAMPENTKKEVTQNNKFDKPKTVTEIELSNIWKCILNQNDAQTQQNIIKISRHDNFFDLGGKSLMAAFLISKIQETFQVHVPLYQLFESSTLAELSKFIENQEGFQFPKTIQKTNVPEPYEAASFAQQQTWNLEASDSNQSFECLTPIQPNGTRPPLFCIPAAGNTALGFVTLARHLKQDQPIYGLNPVGLEKESKPHECTHEMAAYYLKEIQTLQPSGPYYLLGSCFGGNVAFELAQQLESQGEKVAFLAILDTPAPYYIPDDYNNESYIKRIKFRLTREKLHHLIIDILIFRQYRMLKVKIEDRLHPEKARLRNLMNAHLKARENYVPKGAFSGDIKIFRSSTFYDQEKAGEGQFQIPWSDYVKGDIDYQVISGNHVEILTGSRYQELIQKLETCLDETQAEQLR